MSRRSGTMFVFSSHDIATAQGTTEPYYVCERLSTEYDIEVFAPLSDRIDGVRTHPTKVGGIAGILLMNVLLLPYWLWLSLVRSPDVVYTYRNIVIPPYLFKLVGGSTLIYDIRADPYQQPKEMGPDSTLYAAFVRLSKRCHTVAFGCADAIITLSVPLQHQLSENFGVPESKIHVVPLGVDTSMFNVVEVQDDAFHVVYVGSINEYRELDIVVKALTSLVSRIDTPVRFDVFGSADERYIESLADIANRGGVRLKWHGFVEHSELPRLAGQADVAVSPLADVTSFEVSSPAKIYEYLAMGLPVVATRIAPHERILTDGRDSILVPPGEAGAFTEAFQKLATDQALLADYSAAAREKGERNSWASRIESIIEIVDNAREAKHATADQNEWCE